MPVRFSHRLLLLSALLLGAVSCGNEDAEGSSGELAVPVVAEAASVRGGSVAVLTATSVSNRSGRLPGTGSLSLRAVFAVHSDVRRSEVLDLLDLPSLLELGATDTCVLQSGRTGAPNVGWVDLLDAGVVDFVAGARRFELEGQEFPTVSGDMSGVTYAGSASQTRRAEGAFVRFQGSGSGKVGPFSVEVGIPDTVRLHFVEGQTAANGRVDVFEVGDLSVRWDLRGSQEEPLIIELSRSSFGARDVLRCVVNDDGVFTIPGDLRALLPAHEELATDKLTIRRVTDAEFYAGGVDEGWVFYISEDYVLLD